MTATPATSPPPTLKLGLAEYAELPDDNHRYELIDGDVQMTPAPCIKHQSVTGRLYRHLAATLEDTGLGRVFIAPTDVMLGPHDIVQPDILFVRADNAGIIGEQRITGAPDLVVEVLSPASRRRDTLLKRRLYARYGVAHYWLADPDTDRIERFALGDDGYDRVAIDEAPNVLHSADFPGLQLDLARLFA